MATSAKKAKKTPKKAAKAKPKPKAAAKKAVKKPAKKAVSAKKAPAKKAAKAKPKSKPKTKPKATAKAKPKAKAAKTLKKKPVSPKATAKKSKTKSAPAGTAARTAPVKPARKPAAKVTSKPAAKPVQKPSAGTSARKSASRKPVLTREFLLEVATTIRKAVAPLVRAAKGREIIGSATSGDATFQLDKVAERALLNFLRDAKKPVAFYSEDAGYTTFTSAQPEHLLIVDPVDGSRAAKSGFESCVVSVASTRVIERPRMSDVDNGIVMEITGPRTFYAQRGKGARIYVSDAIKKAKLSRNANLEQVSWSMTVPARPAELIFPTAAKLIDLSSLKGGFFACNSTSYSLTRLLTNQLDACVDFANRFLRDIPEAVEDQFINAGRGIVLGIAPYDIAASYLIAIEAGCYVTDAYGESLDDVLLLDSSTTNHRSLIAAANKELHEKLMSFFDIRIQQFEQLLTRRSKLAGQ
ncbi:MAG: hypothetical protein KJ052_07020 [Candidatus Hydrogenedentes bacterium]|nr:hypothetical protein [Candidatus Hydrogenedentota bacterium]